MVDEIQTKKEGDAVVSNDEIDAVTRKVLEEGNKEKKKMEVDVEAKIRAKIESENHLKELEKQNQQFKESIQRQEAEKQKISEAKDKEIEELKAKVGGSKAQINNQSPFKNKEGITQNPRSGLDFVKTLSDEQRVEVQEESQKAFMKELGMPDNDWKC